MRVIGGIEAGGTKFVCAIGDEKGMVLDETRFPTTSPDETIGRAIDFFRSKSVEYEALDAIGIGSFGPIDLDRESATYGYVTTTPKRGWANADFAGAVARALNVPVGFDTDVNGAAMGEWKWGAAQSLHTFVYFTIGTGVGGGVMASGRLLHGLVHPEIGHVRVPHDWASDPFEGCCPYHGDCFEGMASGTAIGARWKKSAADLPEDHPAWDLEASYIASALHSVVCTLSPQRIILGGGVMEQSHLFPKIRERLIESLNGYVQSASIISDIGGYVVPPALGNRAGVMGAFALGLAELD
jgi:fructokinase